MPDGEAIEAGIVTRSIESAQRKVEARNFDVRKQLLEYDDVANDQRKVIYQQRTELMGAENLGDAVRGIRAEVVGGILDQYLPSNVSHEEWNLAGLADSIARNFGTEVDPVQWLKDQPELDEQELRGRIIGAIDSTYDAKVARIGNQPNGQPIMRHIEKDIMLKVLDQQWRDHLGAMDYLRQGIHLRGYAQKNPKQEYKREAFELFSQLLDVVKMDVTRVLMTVRIQSQEEVAQAAEAIEDQADRVRNVTYTHPNEDGSVSEEADPATLVAEVPKVGRNDPCPCGSGKKYKQCHGRLA